MIIKQLSVFVENKFGRVTDIISALGKNNIDISALSLADASEFGILRLIVDDPEKAKEILTGTGVIVRISNVVAAPIEDVPGGLDAVLTILKNNGISIEYMYAFAGRDGKGKACVVFGASDNEAAEQALEVL